MAQCHCIFGWKTFWISSNFRFIKMSFNVIFFPISGYFSWVSFYLFCNIKPSNNQFCFSQCFPRIFLSFSCWKRKQTFLWSKTEFLFSQFWTSRKLVFFFKPFSIFQQLPYQMVAWLSLVDQIVHFKFSNRKMAISDSKSISILKYYLMWKLLKKS